MCNVSHYAVPYLERSVIILVNTGAGEYRAQVKNRYLLVYEKNTVRAKLKPGITVKWWYPGSKYGLPS